MFIDEIRVAAAPLFESRLKKYGKTGPATSVGGDGDISAVADVISTADQPDSGSGVRADDLESEESAPIERLISRIIEDAYISGTADIHIEPMEKDLLVPYRVGGLCAEKLRLPKPVANALVTRLKIMCNLDIAERRLPQDGRVIFKKYPKKNIDIDLRVAPGPMNQGKQVVMRILDKAKSTLPSPALGFSEDNLRRYRQCIQQPYGMILHCGPTGSGKSLTRYSALAEINDAPSTISRMGEMGVGPFNISAARDRVCAQRLLRRVCQNCKMPYPPESRKKKLLEDATPWSSEKVEVAELKRIAMRIDIKTLHQGSRLKVKQGVTTIEDARANVPPDLNL